MTPPDADDKLTADELAGMARALAPGSSGSRQQARWFDAEALAAQLAAAVPGYDAVAPLGHGGMGAVFKARRIADGRAVAIKVLLPGLSADEGFRERFRREAAAMIELDHPNIVSVFESGEAGDLCFLVMEYVGGAPLRDRLAGGPLPAGEARRIAADLCAALQSAHDRGVLHRDIKPGNILLAEDGTVKLADFGLAKLVGARAEADRDYTLTLTDAALGTPAYMAPEQLRGAASIDQRADLYSLGAVLYEMLAGAPPVGDFEPPSTLAAADPEARRLDAAVLRALRNRPSDRFASASAMAAELARAAHASQPGRRRAWQIAALAAPALGAAAWGAAAFWPARIDEPPPPIINSLGIPLHAVEGTSVRFAAWETRVRDFAEFVEASNYLDGEPPACFRLPPGDASTPVFDATWRDPGFAQGGDHPVIGVSYEDALAFCGWLTGRERATSAIRPDQEYRLPTDAEWTVAADFHGPYPWGNALPPGEGAGNFGDVAYAKTYRKSRLAPYDDGFAETAPAEAFAPNRFGLHHMAGNVWEWTGAPDAEGKIAFRGASWSNDHLGGYGYQLSNRWNSLRAHDIGFRIVLASAKASAEGR